MNSKLRFALGSLVGLALLPLGAEARDTGFYLGGGLGQGQVEVIGEGDIVLPDFTFDEDDTAWKIFGGYNWSLPVLDLGVEGGYVNLGKPSQSFSVLNEDVRLEVEPTGWNIWGTAGLGLGPIDVYGKIGYIFWDIEATGSVAGEPPVSDSDDGNDIGYGIGGRFKLGQLGIRLEYEIYDIEDSEDVSMWSVGVEWLFK